MAARTDLVDGLDPTARGVAAPASQRLDEATSRLTRALASRLTAHYGRRLKGLLLFGSRARGDFREDSDADVAVVLQDHVEHPFAIKCEIIDQTYDLFLDTGILVQAWPLEERWLGHPDDAPYPHIVRAVVREGVPL